MPFTGDSVEEKNKIELFDPGGALMEHSRSEAMRPVEPLEAEEGVDLRAYWYVLKKRRWIILSVLSVIFTTALVGTLKEKPVYRAQTMIEIEKQNPEILSVQELFQLENVSDAYLETQYRILKSESLAKRVVASLHLEQVKELNPAANDQPAGANAIAARATAKTAMEPQLLQAIVRNFEDRLRIQPIVRSRLVLVNFDSEDPDLAAIAANSLASNYIQESLDSHWEAMEKARDWLAQQLDDLKIALEKSEDELQRYAEANSLAFLESDTGNTENIANGRLRQLQDELTKAQADRYQKESVFRLVQTGDYSSVPGTEDNTLLQNLALRLSDLETERARLGTTFAANYPRVLQVQNQTNEVRKALASEQRRMADRIANDYEAAVRREALVQRALVAQQNQANEVAVKTVQYNILKREVDTNKQLYDALLTRLKEAGVSAGLKASPIRIVDSAVPPTVPVKPRVVLNLSLALALGTCCAVGIAFLQEHLDNTLKTPDDVERILHLPSLALIPAFKSLNGHPRGVYGLPSPRKLLANGRSNGQAKAPEWYRIDKIGPEYAVLSEAFRSLRTSVLLSTADRPPRSLLITSARPGEGKTTISANLAISLAQLGQRVLLVDGDLRRPNIHKIFRVPPRPGFVSYLAGHHDWPAVIIPTAIPGLDIIPCGPVPPNPAELLFSERARALFQEAPEKYTMVLVDSPPILNVADSRVLSVLVDGVVIVVRGNVTPRELAQRAQAHARDAGAHVIGVVLNSIDVQRMDYYSYGYSKHDAYISEPQLEEKLG
jgi:polysaccharide biosynthesis transport protein